MKRNDQVLLAEELSELIPKLVSLISEYDLCKMHLIEHLLVKREPTEKVSKISKPDIEHQKYLEQVKNSQTSVAFDIIARKISALLKNSPVPLSTGQIYEQLVEKENLPISYSNLSCNILRRMRQEEKYNVERIYRGY